MPHPVPSRHRLRWRSGAVATLLTLVLTACGQAGGEPAPATASDSSPTPSPTESPAESPSGSPSGSPSESPSESPPESPAGPTLEVRVAGDAVTPAAQQVDLGVGETLTLQVRADRAGELHVHSQPEQLLEFGAGTERFELTLDTPGAVDLEEHESGVLVARLLVR